jgi:hypothetical protein
MHSIRTNSDILGLSSFSEITPQHTSLFARGMTSIGCFTDVAVFPSSLDIDYTFYCIPVSCLGFCFLSSVSLTLETFSLET